MNTSYTQQALAVDASFRLRVKNALAVVSWQILSEASTVPNHAKRIAYATAVAANLESYAATVAPWLVTRPNLVNFDTSYNFERLAVVTTSGDPDIESQLASDWDILAGL